MYKFESFNVLKISLFILISLLDVIGSLYLTLIFGSLKSGINVSVFFIFLLLLLLLFNLKSWLNLQLVLEHSLKK